MHFNGVHKIIQHADEIALLKLCHFTGDIVLCYLPTGRSVLGKTVPEVLSTASGRRPSAVLKTEGSVFPNTASPRPANLRVYFFLP